MSATWLLNTSMNHLTTCGKFADVTVPSADEPAEFIAQDETELDITNLGEALDTLLWQEVVEDVAAWIISWSEAHDHSLEKSMALPSC